MRIPRRMGVALACSAAAVGCSGGVVTDPAPAFSASPPPLDAPGNMAPDFVVVTHAPDWTVTVAGRRMRLADADGTREFEVDSNEALFDGRNVVARDARATLEVRVTPRSCQDAATGTWLPYTARVTLDAGEPRTGCARDP